MVITLELHRVSPPPATAFPSAPNIYSAVPVQVNLALYLYTERKQTRADL